MKKYLIFCCTFSFLYCLGLAPVQSQEATCTQVIENACSGCHDVGTVCSKVKKNKSRATWKKTVLKMVDEGAEITKKEQKMLVTCLSSPNNDVKNLCAVP